jgi:hypothetical protein
VRFKAEACGKMSNPALVLTAMTPNSLRIRASFSFKGEDYELDTVIDLDRSHSEPGETPNFHLLLARACGIDPYSYLYEVLESHDLEFFEATGAAAEACRDGVFDWAQFEQARRSQDDWESVRTLAEQTLTPQELDARPELMLALLAAYRAGRMSAG